MSLEVALSCFVLFGIEVNLVLCCWGVSHAFIRYFVDEVKNVYFGFQFISLGKIKLNF